MQTDFEVGAIRRKDVQRRFDRAAATIDAADFVQRTTADGLFERLEPMRVEVMQVLDLGCATGKSSERLARHFRRARVTGVDLSLSMLKRSKSKRGFFSHCREVQADANQLPFGNACIDVIFANLLLPWITEPPGLFAEIARVLRVDGLFVFATLGPDSLAELRDAWTAVDAAQHVNRFWDMHDIGDQLVQAGLRDPVLDVDQLAVNYQSVESLFADLTACGARNALSNRSPALTGRARFADFRNRLAGQAADSGLNLSLELVYGHAWGGGPRQAGGEFHLGVEQIGRRRR